MIRWCYVISLAVLLHFSTLYAQEAKELGISPKELQSYQSQYKRPTSIPYPKDNPYSLEKANLGKMLFFEPRLSRSSWISCATCHNPALGWEDGLSLGLGDHMEQLGRHTPTIINMAFTGPYFWDGRAKTLEEQALGPIASTKEMNLPLDQAIKRLKDIPGYVASFKKAFPKDQDPVNQENLAKAIATFERTVVSWDSPFDDWIKGNKKALTLSQKRGFVVFNDKAKCASCHSGWNFTDNDFHDLGLVQDKEDKGKGEFNFKTPGLRNLLHRAPYMHDGQKKTLADVVEFYNKGGESKRETVSGVMTPLELTTQEKEDLVAFLHSLQSKKDVTVTVPMLP